MVTAKQRPVIFPVSRTVTVSLVASTVAGIVFGLYMQTIGMIPMIASLAGSESLFAGWTLHMIISWTFGLGYGAMTRFSNRYIILGAVHGLLIWLIGPIIVMPLMMGMGTMFAEILTGAQLTNLITHLGFSLITAFIFTILMRR
ncbi:hypothetical protein [Jeotgalibacillus aurantiacus]|uniref:hypothetical protein n=1 Tax=Jeotgalibacillus aurantiacus TaxID=2763266 RepID=UPI001D0B03C1|nr:hypothetical protein [Jeotgalibacillus aurantiacus]